MKATDHLRLLRRFLILPVKSFGLHSRDQPLQGAVVEGLDQHQQMGSKDLEDHVEELRVDQEDPGDHEGDQHQEGDSLDQH